MSESNSSSPQVITPSTLKVIRVGLISGVLIAGAVLWFFMDPSEAPLAESEFVRIFRWVIVGLFGGGAIAIFWVHHRWSAAETFKQKASLNITGWALAEGLALAGAVFMYLVANPAYFIVGVIVQVVVSFAFLPVPEAVEEA